MKSRAAVRLSCALALAALCLVMTGCSFQVSVPVLKGVVLPGQSSIGLKADAPGEKIVVGPRSMGEICGFESAETFQESVMADLEDSLTGIPALLVGVMKVTGVLLDEMEFSATQGDFSTIKRIVMDMRAGGESTGMFVSENPEGFGAIIELMANPPYDLLEDTGGNCVEPFYTLEGDIPEEDVVFDVIMHLTVKYRVALF